MKLLYNSTEISRTRTFCYQYNDNTYRILKMDNKSNENSIIKVKTDGILEVRTD